MKSIFARTIAIIAAGSVISLAGGGVGSASTGEPATGTGSATTSTPDIVEEIQQLREQLAAALDAADLQAISDQAEEVKVLVSSIIRGPREATSDEVVMHAMTAEAEASDIQAALEEAAGERGAADPLAMLNGLIQGLLATLSELSDSILGSAPGLPETPELPEAPEPELPDPGLPTP